MQLWNDWPLMPLHELLKIQGQAIVNCRQAARPPEKGQCRSLSYTILLPPEQPILQWVLEFGQDVIALEAMDWENLAARQLLHRL